MFLILQTPVFADMEIKEFGGAPGLTVRDKPVPALMGSPAPPGAGFYMNDSKLQMKSAPGQVVRLISNNGFPDAFTIDAELTMSKALSGDANITISVNTLDAYQRYALYLNHAPAGNSIVLSRSERPIYNEKIIDIPYPWVMGQPVRLKMSVDNGHITVHADGKEIGSVTDPEPLPPGLVQLSVYSAEGLVDSIRLKDTEENTLLNEDFDGEASVNWAQVVRKLEQQVPAFAEIGINIYTAGCGSFPSDWTGPGKYNWTSVDNFLKNLAELDPDATLLARVNINPPKWWFNENPDDEMVMIQRGKGEQIKRGFASFSSDEWRKDAGEALKNLIQHLKTSTEGHRITGITICGGVSAEWVYSWGTDFHDYSPVQKAAFRRWLRNRYGNSEKNLQDAWNDGKATFETAEIPAPARRAAGDFYEFFDPSKSRQVTDYMRFHSEAVSGAIVHFARVIKEADTDIFTTVFYGYQFPSYNHYHDMGHNDLLTVLQSPYLDSVCCPHTYQNRQAGGSTTAVLPVDSVRLHGKLWFDEDDTRTHLSTPTSSYGRANNLWESVNILKRNFVHALSKSAGLWHMDWNKGWLADEGIMETIAVHRRMAEESLNKDRRPNSEIAVVVSEQSLDYIRSSFGIVRTMYKNQYHDQMPRIGAPFDTILLEDLEIAPDYKFYIFMDTFYVTERQRAVIEKKVKRNGNTALWLFGAGYVTDKGLSDAAMKELTGIDIAAYDGGGKMRMTLCDAEHPITRGVMPGIQFETADETGPLFYSRDKDARILGMTNVVPCTNSEGVFKSGSETMPGFVVKEMDNWHSVWCAVPNIPPALLRNMAKEAGVHIYSDGDDVVYANRFIVSVTARYGGERTIKLPKPCMVVDAFTGEVVSEKTGSFNADLKQYETKIWRLEY